MPTRTEGNESGKKWFIDIFMSILWIIPKPPDDSDLGWRQDEAAARAGSAGKEEKSA